MPVTFAITGVIDRLRASVAAALTAAGEEPQKIPSAETADQVAYAAADLPITVLQMMSCKISTDDCPVNSLRFCQPVTIHHIRGLSPNGNASDTATARLAAIAAAIFADYRLESVSADTDNSIEQVHILGIDRGEDNPVQMLLDVNEQNISMAAVSLRLEIDWIEDED